MGPLGSLMIGGAISQAADMAYNTWQYKDNQQFTANQAAINRDWQSNENSIARNFNAEQAGIMRDWQEKMSNSAAQRQVADYKKAGLNPAMLSGGATGAPNYASSAASTSPGGVPGNPGAFGTPSNFSGMNSSLMLGVLKHGDEIAKTALLHNKFKNDEKMDDFRKLVDIARSAPATEKNNAFRDLLKYYSTSRTHA